VLNPAFNSLPKAKSAGNFASYAFRFEVLNMNSWARTFVATALVLLVSGTAGAWETRVLTLGDQNRFIQDDANIWIYPHTMVKYGDRLYLDLDRKEGRVVDSLGEGIEDYGVMKNLNGGMMLQMSEGFHLGFWASNEMEPTSRLFLEGANTAQTDPDGCDRLNEVFDNDNCRLSSQDITGDAFRGALRWNENASRKFDIFAGFDLGADVLLGFHTWWGNSSASVLTERTVDIRSGETNLGPSAISNERLFDSTNFGFGAGIAFKPWREGDLDIGFRYTYYKYELTEDGVSKPIVDAGHRLTLDSRLIGRLSKHWWFAPSLQFTYLSFTGAVDNQAAPGQDTGRGNYGSAVSWQTIDFDLGLGLHMRVIDKATLYTAIGLDYGQSQFNANSNWGADRLISLKRLQLPYWRTGFEAPLFDWMHLRAGFVKRWSRTTYTDDFLDPGAERGALDEIRRRGSKLEDVSFSEDQENLLRDFDTFVGATFHHRGWNFAVEIDPTLLYFGPFRNATYTPIAMPAVDADGAGGDADADAGGGAAAPWFARFEISYRF